MLSDGEEYYGKHSESGQHKKMRFKFITQVLEYREHNGIAERKNRTLLNRVRSMICTSSLPKYLWGEALKITNYLTNRSHSKSVTKTSFEL